MCAINLIINAELSVVTQAHYNKMEFLELLKFFVYLVISYDAFVP
jgi:hypothetical protein